MASTYSDLKIQLMATGENNTTWGNVTNVNLGTALEEAIAESADVTFASDNQTISLTDTNATQTARHLRINCTGTTGGATRNLVVPTIEKPYIIKNGCADSILVKTSAGTGITVPTGKTMWVYVDGTNVVDVTTHLTSLTLGTPLPVASGGTGANTGANALANLGGLATATNINVTAILGLSDGSVSAPTIYWGSDSNTGLYHSTADTINMTIGGSNAFSLNPSNGGIVLGRGGTVSNTAGSSIAIGTSANCDTAANSIAIGRTATATGANCIAIGNAAAASGSSSIVIGTMDSSSYTGTGVVHVGTSTSIGTVSGNNLLVLGTGARPANILTSANEATLGDSSIATLRCQVTTITSLSDERDKDEIEPLHDCLKLVETVEPYRYKWNARDGAKVGIEDTGFTAQQLQRAMSASGVHIPGLVYDINPEKLEAGYGKLIPVLLGAIKELSDKVKALEDKSCGVC